MSSYEDVELNYQSIKESFEVLRRYLIKQLNKCFITGIDNYNFTELIEAVGEIQSVEYYNSNNIKPTQKPAIDTTNLTTYNETLFFRIRYYMRLLAYFLCLKGVPTDKIADQHDLAGLISLIDFIDVKLPTTMTVQEITEEYYFGLNILLDYTLVDIYGEDVKDGEITIEADGILYDSIEVGQPISFTPLRISEKVNGVYEPITVTITYIGSDKYQSYPPITRDIIVKPAKITLDIFMYNINTQSQYYNSSVVGYSNDTWNMMIKTYNYKGEILPDIPFTISITEDSEIDNSVDGDIFLNSDTSIDDVTDENGVWSQDFIINQIGEKSINITTTYEDTDLISNVEVIKKVYIYYCPLYLEQKNYIDYVGKNQYQYKVIIRDVYTGVLYSNSLNGQKASIFLDEVQLSNNINIVNGQAIYTFSSIDVGEHKIRWEINGNQTTNNVKIYSNFILPNKNKFFLSDTPDFYYTPLYTATYQTEDWSPIIRKKAIAWVYYYGENVEEGATEVEYSEEENYDEPSNHYELILIDDTSKEMYTDSKGILHDFKEYPEYIVPRKYAVKLKTSSDNLNEEFIDFFEYEIAKPFDIFFDEEQSNKKEKAVFNIKVYDKEHYQIGQHTNYISFNKNFTGLYSINESENDEYYNINIIIPMREETIGTNTLTVTINNYTENANFKLTDKIFRLLTNNVDIGDQQIQIQCYDDDIEDITIDNEYIIVNEYTKTNGIFTIDATFIKAGNIDFIISSEEDNESFTITVNKGDITPTILIEQYIPYTEEVFDEETQTNIIVDKNYVNEVDECYYDDINTIHIQLIMEPIYENIEITYEFGSYTESYMSNDENIYFTVPNVTPGEYNVSFTYYSNSNSSYNSFSVNKTFTILKAIPTHEITEKYTTFKDTNFFVYHPQFTAENPADITMFERYPHGGYSTQKNGIWTVAQYYLTDGWYNTGTWECDFDLKTEGNASLRYTGIGYLIALSPTTPAKKRGGGQYSILGGWEGVVDNDPPGSYTRTGADTLTIANGSPRYETVIRNWVHFNIKKTSPTTLIITKTNDVANNGTVIYEWQELSNYEKFTFGVWNNEGFLLCKMQIKDFIVRGVH